MYNEASGGQEPLTNKPSIDNVPLGEIPHDVALKRHIEHENEIKFKDVVGEKVIAAIAEEEPDNLAKYTKSLADLRFRIAIDSLTPEVKKYTDILAQLDINGASEEDIQSGIGKLQKELKTTLPSDQTQPEEIEEKFKLSAQYLHDLNTLKSQILPFNEQVYSVLGHSHTEKENDTIQRKIIQPSED